MVNQNNQPEIIWRGVSNGEEQMAKLTLSLATCNNECITSLCPFFFFLFLLLEEIIS